MFHLSISRAITSLLNQLAVVNVHIFVFVVVSKGKEFRVNAKYLKCFKSAIFFYFGAQKKKHLHYLKWESGIRNRN